MGTPEFAVPTLKGLIDTHQVVGVVTQRAQGDHFPLPELVGLGHTLCGRGQRRHRCGQGGQYR